MAITPLRLTTTPFPSPSPRALCPTKPHAPPKPFSIRATKPEPEPKPETETTLQQPESDSFESRVSRVRFRYRSGTGKKAEIRKSKKKRARAATSSSSSGIYLPPVPLKEPVSGGLRVDFGFSQYSEKVNGRLAILGVAALLLVELATGKSVVNYHTPAIVLIQVYFVAAVSALYIKYEKEKVSVWPQSEAKD